MKIRCKNCYRVLNHDEEYCTRCGERSLEVVKLMNGEIVDDAIDYKFKTNLWIYLGVAFLLNGVLSIILSVFFKKANPDLLITEVGTALPESIAFFSFSNAALCTGVIILGVLLITFYKDIFLQIKKDFVVLFQKKMLPHLLFLIIVAGALTFIIKFTDVLVIPPYFKSFLDGSLSSVYDETNFGVLKICITLAIYSFVIEYIFKHMLYGYLQEVTLMKEGTILTLMVVLSMLAEFLTFGFTSTLTLNTFLYWLLGNFVLNYLLAIWYTAGNKNLLLNVLVRIILLVLIVLFI